MNLLLTGIAAGVLGTLAMDLGNHLGARAGLLVRIDVGAIGRMAAGWARGRFRYRAPGDMARIEHERLLGSLTHYGIGLGLAVPFVLVWGRTTGEAAPPGWLLAYGVLTTAASVFLVSPSMGLGMFGRRSPDGVKAPLSSLANHTFFGAGMAAAAALLRMVRDL